MVDYSESAENTQDNTEAWKKRRKNAKAKLKRLGFGLYDKYHFNSTELLEELVDAYQNGKDFNLEKMEVIFDTSDNSNLFLLDLVTYYPNLLKKYKVITDSVLMELEGRCKNTIEVMCNSDKKHSTVRSNLYSNGLWIAKENNLPFTITSEDIFLPTHCALLGIEINYNNPKAASDSPSLDCIDVRKGYVVDNIQVISSKANRMKSDCTPDELLAFAKRLQEVYQPVTVWSSKSFVYKGGIDTWNTDYHLTMIKDHFKKDVQEVVSKYTINGQLSSKEDVNNPGYTIPNSNGLIYPVNLLKKEAAKLNTWFDKNGFEYYEPDSLGAAKPVKDLYWNSCLDSDYFYYFPFVTYDKKGTNFLPADIIIYEKVGDVYEEVYPFFPKNDITLENGKDSTPFGGGHSMAYADEESELKQDYSGSLDYLLEIPKQEVEHIDTKGNVWTASQLCEKYGLSTPELAVELFYKQQEREDRIQGYKLNASLNNKDYFKSSQMMNDVDNNSVPTIPKDIWVGASNSVNFGDLPKIDEYKDFAKQLRDDLQQNIETARETRRKENQKTLWGRMKNLFFFLLECGNQGPKP